MSQIDQSVCLSWYCPWCGRANEFWAFYATAATTMPAPIPLPMTLRCANSCCGLRFRVEAAK